MDTICTLRLCPCKLSGFKLKGKMNKVKMKEHSLISTQVKEVG